VVGADGSTYTQAGEWNFNMSARALRSTDHYKNDIEQVQRQTLGTYVVNQQRALDLSIGRQMTPRVSLAVGVPFISASWSIPRPTSPTPGPRAQEDAFGLGDISVSVRSWVFNTRSHPTGNFAVGVGLKMPTGKSNVTDQFVGSNGLDNEQRYVDMSVQPGDGGWGITTEISGFKRIKRLMLFGSGNYLINPRDTNGTPTNGQLIGTTPDPTSTRVNSVPDQYLVRLGSAIGIGRGYGLSVAYRVEGMPRYDLIGRSDGFRRPGLEMFIEPGISYSKGSSSFGFTVPIGVYRNRKPNPYTDTLGDATFPRFIILGTYSVRFGSLKSVTSPVKGPGTLGSTTHAEGAGSNGVGGGAILAVPPLDRGQEVARLDVSGMTCDVCVETVQSALQAAPGVVSAKVSLAEHQALVVYQPSKTTVDDLVKVVNRTKGMNPYTARAQSATVTLAITGMTCEVCVQTVQSALQAVNGVAEAKVSLDTNLAHVTYDPSRTKVKDLLNAVKNAKGMNPYSATVVQ
jgi:copper chaperone CopZ